MACSAAADAMIAATIAYILWGVREVCRADARLAAISEILFFLDLRSDFDVAGWLGQPTVWRSASYLV